MYALLVRIANVKPQSGFRASFRLEHADFAFAFDADAFSTLVGLGNWPMTERAKYLFPAI